MNMFEAFNNGISMTCIKCAVMQLYLNFFDKVTYIRQKPSSVSLQVDHFNGDGDGSGNSGR